jgi:subtilisin family serine protease
MVQSGRFIRGILLSSLCVLAVGCGAQKQRATLNPRSDGVLVQANKSDLQKNFPNAEIVTVSAQHNLYKLNVELDAVQKLMPGVTAEENVVIQIRNPKHDTTDKLFSKNNTIREIIQQIQCVRSPSTPTADISYVSGGDFLAMNNVRAGSSPILLTAKNSSSAKADGMPDWLNFINPQPEAKASNPLSYHWILEAPPGSRATRYSNEVNYTLTPDVNGGYTVMLLVQDKVTKVCDLTGISVGATIDVGYAGPQFTWSQPKDFQKFFHLKTVQADQVWSSTDGKDTVVAVIDSGLNYNHPDLANALYINTREIPNNGFDDDGNGYIDDVYGYDFAFGDNYPFDDESHGTHVAGLIAGTQSGVAPGAKILPIKAIYPTGSATLSSVVSSILYATQMKVDIINMSLGGEGETSALVKSALERARKAGILVVVASGNSAKNVDVVPFFMNEKDGANVLAVGATDEAGNLTRYSNYGVKNVGIAAPGGTDTRPIMSTYSYYNFGAYVGYPGTSMAAPIVAGVAALAKSINKNLYGEQLKQVLKQSALTLPNLMTTIQNGKFVNAAGAVRVASSTQTLAQQ